MTRNRQRWDLSDDWKLAVSSKRENFTLPVRNTLAHRASYSCSNPQCQAPTAGPSEEAANARSDVGVAAHITAASRGGPRFDKVLSDAERCAIENAVWLCQVCAKKVDDDVITYPAEVGSEMPKRARRNDWDAQAQRPTPKHGHVILLNA